MDDREKIIKQINSLYKCMENGDLEGSLRHYSLESFAIGTGTNEITSNFEDLEVMLKLTLAENNLKVTESEILNLKTVGNVAWGAFTAIFSIAGSEGVPVRFTVVWEKVDNRWLISQIHFSVAQIGLEEGQGWPTKEAMREKIDDLINDFGLNPNLGDEGEKIKEYLLKAKEIASTLS